MALNSKKGKDEENKDEEGDGNGEKKDDIIVWNRLTVGMRMLRDFFPDKMSFFNLADVNQAAEQLTLCALCASA